MITIICYLCPALGNQSNKAGAVHEAVSPFLSRKNIEPVFLIGFAGHCATWNFVTLEGVLAGFMATAKVPYKPTSKRKDLF